jgi:hypothetical protein
MSILGEMDLYTKLTISPTNYTKRYAMRLKILDLNYKMVHELETEPALYYQFFLKNYAETLKKVLPIYIKMTTIEADLCPTIAANPKDFDAVMILYNEVLIHFLFSIEPSTPLCLHLGYTIDENRCNSVEFILTNNGKKRTTDIVVGTTLSHFAKAQKVVIQTISTPEMYRIVFTPMQ